MVDYTTVRIKKDSLEKINKMKGEDGSVADVIGKLLDTVDGCNIDDVIDIYPPNQRVFAVFCFVFLVMSFKE